MQLFVHSAICVCIYSHLLNLFMSPRSVAHYECNLHTVLQQPAGQSAEPLENLSPSHRGLTQPGLLIYTGDKPKQMSIKSR